MKEKTRGPIRYDYLISGLAVLGVGILLLLQQLGNFQELYLLDLWPALLIVMGVCYLVDREHRDARPKGLFLSLAGALLRAGNFLPERHTMEISLGWLDFRLSWPMLLVIIGVYIAGRDYLGRSAVAAGPALEKKS